jgi:hypothetical protein
MDFGMEIAFLMGMFALPVAAIIILITMGIIDYKYSKKKKYFNSLIEVSKEKNGITFTRQVLEKCVNLPLDSMINVFEHHCNVKTKNNT